MSLSDPPTFLTPAIMAGVDWKALELAIVRVLQHAGWKDVRNVGQTGDGGADILATKLNNKTGAPESYLFQSKAVSGDGYVGKSALEQAIKAQSIYGAKIVVVVTNGEFYQSVYLRKQELASKGFDARLWNGTFLKSLHNRLPEYSLSRRAIRPYQEAIVEKVLSNYHAGRKKSFFVLATGLGKTVIAASVVDTMLREGLKRALVVCHSVDLAAQLEQAFWGQLPKDVITRRFLSGSPPLNEPGVIFGLYQTLIQYIGSLPPDAFDIIVVDEAHRALANAFSTAINHLTPKHLIGMTATPWRGDGAAVESIFGEPLARVSLVDGMRMGYLARVDYKMMCDNIDWDEMPKLAGKSISVRDLNKRLFLPQRDDAVASAILEQAAKLQSPRVLIFSPSKRHATEFAKRLTAGGLTTACASVDDRIRRNRILLDFSVGKLKALTAVDVLNEGIDFPSTNLLVFLRATHSRRIFVQQLGRGLRLSGVKESVAVLDFVTDLRRLAAVSDLDREARRDKPSLLAGEVERVVLKDGVVTFSNERAKRFIDTWIEDVASLEDSNEAERLQFPEF